MDYNEEALWEAIGMLDRAAEYLLDDCGKRDEVWNDALDEASGILMKCSQKLRVKANKRPRGNPFEA